MNISSVPLSVFRKQEWDKLTISEALVLQLIDHAGMTVPQASRAIGRNYQTIRTTWIRAKKKLGQYRYIKECIDEGPLQGACCTVDCEYRKVCAAKKIPLLIHAVVINRRMQKISPDYYINDIVHLKHIPAAVIDRKNKRIYRQKFNNEYLTRI